MSSISEAISNLREKLGSLGKKGGGDSGGESSGGAGKFDAKVALAWVKANPVIVACVGVMVVVPATAWWFASDMRAQRAAAAESRAQEWGNLEKLERSTVEIALPGVASEPKTGVVSQATVASYERLAKRLKEDARRAHERARDANQAGRTALIHDVRVTKENVNLIAEEVFDAVQAKAAAMLADLKVGMPPGDERLADELQRRQDSFIALERKPDRKSLDADQLKRLQAALSETRLQIYADRASALSMYADPATLGMPESAAEAGTPPSEGRMFGWQWRFWAIEDVVRALADANSKDRSVIEAPVKRILSISVAEEAAKPKPPAGIGGEAEAPPAEGVPADGSVPPDGAIVAEAAAPALPPIDLKAAVPYDFSRSMTGRVSNPLYDVRMVTLRVVVATSRLPEVMNAISRRNFMTVTDMSVRPADAFEAADLGFIYGPDQVSEVTMRIETVWLKSWLARLMPAELQKSKGTDGRTSDDPPPAAPDAAPADAAPSA